MNNLYATLSLRVGVTSLLIACTSIGLCYPLHTDAGAQKQETTTKQAERKAQKAKKKAQETADIAVEKAQKESHEIKEKAKETAASATQRAKEKGHEAKEKVGEAVSATAQAAKAKGHEIKEEVREVASTTAHKGKKMAHAAKEGISDAASTTAKKAKAVGQGVKEKVQNVASAIAQDDKKTVQRSEELVYDFTLPSYSGGEIDLADYEGMVIMLVNTPVTQDAALQYEALEALYQHYKNDGFVIIAVESNDFSNGFEGPQYPVTFPKTGVVHTRNHKGCHEACPLYAWLNARTYFGIGAVKGDFHKFLIGRDGRFLDWFAPSTSPNDKKVIKAIEKALTA